jgi:hypothetical protein
VESCGLGSTPYPMSLKKESHLLNRSPIINRIVQLIERRDDRRWIQVSVRQVAIYVGVDGLRTLAKPLDISVRDCRINRVSRRG